MFFRVGRYDSVLTDPQAIVKAYSLLRCTKYKRAHYRAKNNLSNPNLKQVLLRGSDVIHKIIAHGKGSSTLKYIY
ncbi:hypothetical protein CANCADRAFT_31317 [Tortispora caseinolytica NRRL Y-17796]|uniref:Uncharacterized protein n=1 Tax=Tortispora caseinolytica NRRL Y-17796 TaxID=767744 RepID=A0A1E4TEW8_9ASCO|nr:hypothetical protein CANCADRAFT_31317 [Tortispora caseinolytica NRRL Y-17796]